MPPCGDEARLRPEGGDTGAPVSPQEAKHGIPLPAACDARHSTTNEQKKALHFSPQPASPFPSKPRRLPSRSPVAMVRGGGWGGGEGGWVREHE